MAPSKTERSGDAKPADPPKPAKAAAATKPGAPPRKAEATVEATVGETVEEIGGRDGPDPTRYGDYEKDGRCVDF